MKKVIIIPAVLTFVAAPVLGFHFFFPGYKYAGEWDGTGGEAGKFNHPTGVAVDTLGNVCVADWGNHRIQRFTADGDYIGYFLTTSSKKAEDGEAPNRFIKPVGIAVKTAPPNRRYLVTCPDPGYGGFPPPASVIVYEGLNYSDWPLDEHLTAAYPGAPIVSEPRGIAVGPPDYFYVADWGESRIQVFELTYNDEKQKELGKIERVDYWEDSTGDEKLKFVNDVATAPDFTVYVVSKEGIPYFSPNGTSLGWLVRYTEVGYHPRPASVAVAPDGKVFLVDNLNVELNPDEFFAADVGEIKYFDPGDGTELGTLEKPPGTGDWDPRDIAISPTGRVYIADTFNDRIVYYDPDYGLYNEMVPPPEKPTRPLRPEMPEAGKIKPPE